MCGLAFSGKSTLARKIAESTGSKRISFDELWLEKEKENPIPKGTEGWKYIRNVAQVEVSRALKAGKSVVYDDNNPKKEHREEIREIGMKAGADVFIVYLNTPLDVIRTREETNKVTSDRHEVIPENFQAVLDQFEPPTPEENVLEFTPDVETKEFLEKYFDHV